MGVYAASKAAQEVLALEAHRTGGVRVLSADAIAISASWLGAIFVVYLTGSVLTRLDPTRFTAPKHLRSMVRCQSEAWIVPAP